MLTCKQVSKALAEKNYHDLSPLKRFGLRLHLKLCGICRRSNGNIMVFHDIVHAFRQKEELLPDKPRLPETKRQQIREALNRKR